MKNKVVTYEQVKEVFKDGQTIMFGDLHGEMSAEEVIDAILESGIKDIDAISVAGGMVDQGMGRLIADHRVKSLHTTHIGLNPEAKNQMVSGELEIEFIPQGSFTERIRCGGFGLGGCLTKTGLGTSVAEGKPIINVNGEDYLLETPLHADVAVVKASKGDAYGNLKFRLMNRNCGNSYMCYAADIVIAEVEELVEVGELGPDDIDIPAPVVDMIYVRKENRGLYPMWRRAKAKAEAKAAAAKA